MKLKVNKGITLVEVLATIAISGILFSIIGTIISTFNTSYQSSKEIRETDNEIQYIENALSVCVEYVNINGYEMSLENSLENIKILTEIDNEEVTLFSYDITSKVVNLKFSNVVKELKHIKSINIYVNNENRTGIIVEIITINDVKKLSYHNVINLG